MEATMNTPINKPVLINRLVSSKLFWFLMIGFLFAYPVVKSIGRNMPAELPKYGTLPYYNFTNESGHSFGSNNLKGKVYIANFLFTSCQTSCPTLLKTLQSVQHRMRGVIDRAAIISFTVDPEHDSPEVLFQTARSVKAHSDVWRFLTGPKEDIKKLLVDGFKVPVGEKEFANNVMDVAHSEKFVLVDQDGVIRGYYPTDKNGINQLMIDTGILINTTKKSI